MVSMLYFTYLGWVSPAVSAFGTHNHQGFSPDLAINSNCQWHFWFSSGDYYHFVFGKYLKI